MAGSVDIFDIFGEFTCFVLFLAIVNAGQEYCPYQVKLYFTLIYIPEILAFLFQVCVLQGVKISLSTAALSSISNLDCDVLYLIWTTERLQQQLDVIDRRYEL